MNLVKQLLKEYSRKNCELIVAWIGKEEGRFSDLLELFTGNDTSIAKRAVWPLCEAAILHPPLVDGHMHLLLQILQRPNLHAAVKRNITRLFQGMVIPSEHEGTLMDLCFNYLADTKETIAVKVNAMNILEKFAIQYPEIIPELSLLVSDQMDWQSSGYKSRGGKLLSTLSKIKARID